jgi:5-methylthioadenosine/S-adenosylhomocysteine deaminase
VSSGISRLVVALVALLASSGSLWNAIGTAREQAARRRVSLVITNTTVVTVDATRRVLSPGALAIEGSDIVAVDTPAAIAAGFEARETIDAAGQIVLPGLVNTHTHAPMVLYRGLADDLTLMEWLQQYIFPAEAKTVSAAFVRTGTRLAALEMIQSGTTTFTDMYYFEEEVAKAAKEAGLRGVLGQTIIKFPVADAKTPAESLARTERFLTEFRNDPLITPAVAPHALYTLEPDTLKATRALADKYGAPLIIHLAETRAEVDAALSMAQRTPVSYLEMVGLWGPRTLGAHGVWVSPEDMKILAKHGVAVSHNPESNMKLASGTAPVVDYLQAGITLGLGTDGAASNNDLDMFEAMRFAALLHKLQRNDPRVLPAGDVLAMATIGGAKALGLGDRIGSLEPGKRADLIAVSTTGARQTPLYDPISHLVYVAHGDDVTTTVVDGRVLMRDRKVLTLDAPTVLKDARAAADQVRAAVKK